MTIYFKHTQTGKRFKVLKQEQVGDKTILTLEGTTGTTFTETYDKVRFKEFGYTLVKEEDPVEEVADDE
ncbi:hypothetical protein [Silvimonas sp.]|uniref:hypothetical protein n=1 Tax=Silvimonas sp. TaxID=2650811 RepID=UPI0028422853|nr:hypothetical protein [Silvimonas sp.]MDR3427784.1 hypothetical protein [Silvimonas sp.]